MFSMSKDEGKTWTKAIKINEVDGDCIDSDNTTEGAVPAVGPEGELYVSWAGPAGLVFDRSFDGGKTWMDKDIFIIGGSEIINLTFNCIEQFYLTRIYGNYNCEKFIDVSLIEKNMKMIKKIDGDSSCHFEIWEK